MKRYFLALAALIVVASTADAGPLRNLVERRQQVRHANHAAITVHPTDTIAYAPPVAVVAPQSIEVTSMAFVSSASFGGCPGGNCPSARGPVRRFVFGR